jgi:hypothetical protein
MFVYSLPPAHGHFNTKTIQVKAAPDIGAAFITLKRSTGVASNRRWAMMPGNQ